MQENSPFIEDLAILRQQPKTQLAEGKRIQREGNRVNGDKTVSVQRLVMDKT